MPVSGAAVELRKGTEKLAAVTTDAEGYYSFSNMESGEYNIVVISGSQTVTRMVTVVTVDEICDIILPTGAVSSVVEVKPGTPAATVKGLDQEAEDHTPSGNEEVEIRLIAQSVTTPEEVQKTIKEAYLTSLDVNILKIVTVNGVAEPTEQLSETNTVLEIRVPFQTAGRSNITVYRTHDGETKPMTRLDVRPTENFKDGTCFVGDDHLTIYTQKFSVYTVGYDVEITLDANGGKAAAASVKTNADGKAVLPDAVRTDYQFLGWYTEKVDGEQKNSDSIFESGTILYAHWSYVPFQIKIDAMGGSVADSAIATVEGNVLGKLPETPEVVGSREGYHFSGWFTKAKGGEKITENTVFTRPASEGKAPTVYAHWYVNVTLDPNGGKGDSFTVQTDMDDHLLSVPGDPSRENYRFEGWYTDKTGGTKVVVDSEATFTADTTLYAHWSEISGTEEIKDPQNPQNPDTKPSHKHNKKHSSGGSSSVEEQTTKTMAGNPATGDHAPVGLMLTLMLLAIAGLVVTMMKRRKE